MALLHSFEKSGNYLFKYRGQLPVILFVLAIPAIYFSHIAYFASKPILFNCIFALSIALSILGQVIRAIAIGTSQKHTSGRNTQEQVAEALNTKGIYSTMRHPLYVGNYFMWIGIVVFTMNLWFILLVSLAFWLYYERIMFAEERFLERKFGQDYLDWSLQVPAFIPSFKNYEASSVSFSFKTILRREYAGISATILGFLFVAIIRNLFLEHGFHYRIYYGITLTIIFGYALIFKLLKHKTKLLHEEDRS